MKHFRIYWWASVLLAAVMLTSCSSDSDGGGPMGSARLMENIDTIRVTDSTAYTVRLFFGKGAQTYLAHGAVSWKSDNDQIAQAYNMAMRVSNDSCYSSCVIRGGKTAGVTTISARSQNDPQRRSAYLVNTRAQ